MTDGWFCLREGGMGAGLPQPPALPKRIGSRRCRSSVYQPLVGCCFLLRCCSCVLPAFVHARVFALQVNQAREEGGQVQYKDIDARYRMQLVEQRTTEMANSDLEKYHKVSWSSVVVC